MTRVTSSIYDAADGHRGRPAPMPLQGADMRAHPIHTVIAFLLLGALLQASADAHAQWKWRDENGRVHYSDQPPPPGVPPSRIMRSVDKGPPLTVASTPPSSEAASSARGASGGAPAQPGKGAANTPKSWAERALELRKREAERQEDQRKEEDLARKAAALGQVCDGMRSEVRTLESGMRIARVNAQGEQEIVSDEERAARLDVLRKDTQAHCPTS